MRFTKMHGLGNDYVYVDCFDEEVADPSALAKGGKLELEGLLDGEYEIEMLDPRDGKRVHSLKRRASGSVLKIGVPGGVEDIVVRIEAVRKRPVGIK